MNCLFYVQSTVAGFCNILPKLLYKFNKIKIHKFKDAVIEIQNLPSFDFTQKLKGNSIYTSMAHSMEKPNMHCH